MATDLVEFVRMRAKEYGNRVLHSGEDAAISYRAFDEITDRLAYGPEKIGVSKEDHVAFIHPNGPQVLFGYYSSVKAGGEINNGHDTSGEIYVS
jgi:non-ribosomal peptide synthetase component E (peptide arylation enzyme)